MFSRRRSRDSFDSLLSPISSNPNASRSDTFFDRRGSSHSPRPPAHRRSSTASSIHSVGGSLDTSSTGHTLFESGQNAISTLLQPPIVRTGLLPHTHAPASTAHKPPTARDIPPVTLTNIEHVDASEFKSYLSQVGPLYEHLRRVKESEDDSASVLGRRGSKTDDQAEDDGHLRPGRRSASHRKLSNASITSISSLEAPTPTRRSSGGFSTRRSVAHGPPPLSTIPNVYFEDDFHLENPRTFDVVSERSEVVRPAPGTMDEKAPNGNAAAPRKALATNAILQEKLSWYMDTIEIHLIQSISTASTTFFTALGSLRELHSEAAESVDRIKALRKELEALDEEIAANGLTIVEQRRRRENLQQLHDAVLQLREIVHSVSACEALVDAGELEKALDSIDSLEMLIAGDVGATHGGPPGMRLRDLRGAVALQGVSNDLGLLRFRVGKAYEAKFIDILMGDMSRHTDKVAATQEVLMRWSSASMRSRGGHGREPSAFPSYMTSVDELRSKLLPILGGLQRANHLSVATTAFREAVLRQVRNIIRGPLPSSNDDDNESMMSSSTMTGGGRRNQQQKSSILARNLRALEPQDAEEMLVKVYIGVTETLRRLTTQAKVILDVASSIGGDPSLPAGMKSPPLKSPPFSPTRGSHAQASVAAVEAQEEIHKALDLTGLLGQAVDVAQDKIVKLLRVRAEQSSHLALVWFLRYFTLNLHFANECESISGRSGSTLKTVVNGQIKDFVQQHGDKERQRLAQEMESDQWNAKDFGEDEQRLLDEILESSTKDAPSWSEGTKVWTPYSDTDDEAPASGTSEPGQTNGAAKTKVRSAVIEGENFSLPNSAVLCMNGMAHFLHLVVGISYITTDVATSLISYLQLFNSRCTQLILGAGATRSAGLKNITTKHLALASQALGFIAALVPHVREFVRRHCGSGPAVSTVMGEFDKVRRLYQEHQNNIYDKLVEIMSGRASAGAKKMKAIDWDGGGDGVHDYMEILAKETTTLHRNLNKHLPETTVRLIMLPVFRSYKDTFGAALRAAEPRTEAGRDSMFRDIDYFEARLGKLDGFEDAAEYLRGIVKAKTVKPATPPAGPPSPAPPVATEKAEVAPAAAVDGKKPEDAAVPEKKEKEAEKGAEKEGGADSTHDGPGALVAAQMGS